MQFYLTTKRLEKSCLILQNDLFCIYKIVIRKTNQYYIGVTQDLQKRIDNHGALISYLYLDDDYKNVLQFHREAVKHITWDFSKKGIELEREIRALLDVQVLAIIHGKKNAYLLESAYISDSKEDKLCLNIQ